ncbi:MAG: response regulator [Pseudobdellovibrionaceae bacterium]|nr:response regulator [Pseudobdellovibrionaceae bacterium]
MSTILIVDDEYDIAQAIRGILEDEGHHVEVCSNGRHALQCINEKFSDTTFQLILLDVMMPFMSGLDLLKHLRDDKRFSQVPIVLMNNTDIKVSPSDYQWNDFLRKPFDCKTLLQVVNRFGKRDQEP